MASTESLAFIAAKLKGQPAAIIDAFCERLHPDDVAIIRKAQALLPEFADPLIRDPVAWVHQRLGGELWSKQREILESVVANRYTAVHSAHDLGKSFTASCALAWWLDVHPAGSAFAVSTAPTFGQVRAILWREINRRHKEGKLPGKVNQTEWWIDDEMVAMGRKPANYDPAAFQGIHAEYVLVVIDEACGVPKSIYEAVDALVTNEGARVLAIGNPDNPVSEFANVCKPDSGWHVIHLDGLDSPNFTGEPVSPRLRQLLLSEVWVEERKLRWGEDSPIYQAKVRGQFSPDSEAGVVRGSKLAECRVARDWQPADLLPVELGVDVGGSDNGDETVIRERRGRQAGREWTVRSGDAQKVRAKILEALHESGATAVKIDSIGIGWGIVGWLEEDRQEGRHQAAVHGVNVAEKATEPETYALLRDQIWWQIGREFCEDGVWDLGSIDDDTATQLLAPTYGIGTGGRIKVESKDDTRKRLGRSPDQADALLLAYYVPEVKDRFLHF